MQTEKSKALYEHAVHHGHRPLTDDDVDCINVLMRDLSPDHKELTHLSIESMLSHSELFLTRQLVEDDGTTIAKPGGRIVAMATLSRVHTLRGRHVMVEDVVVSPNRRGQGLGRGLMRCLLTHSRMMNYKRVTLTSRAERVEANELYKSLGFVQHETNVYHLAL